MTNEGQSSLKRMSDFEWASAARYMAWLELNLGIEQVDFGKVYSFRIGNGGITCLRETKKRQLSKVKIGIATIEAFAGLNKEELAPEELVVLRSMYCTYRAAIDTINEQLQRVEVMAKAKEASIFSQEEEGESEIPF